MRGFIWGFLFVLQVFLFGSFCFGTILHLQPNQFVMFKLALLSNGGKRQKNKLVSSWPKVQYSVREKKDFTQFLKSPKSPSQEFSWLMPRQKKNPFSGYKGSVAIYGFTVKCWGTVAFEQLYIFLQLVLLWEEAGKKSPTCKYLCYYIRKNKKWKETRVKIHCFTG